AWPWCCARASVLRGVGAVAASVPRGGAGRVPVGPGGGRSRRSVDGRSVGRGVTGSRRAEGARRAGACRSSRGRLGEPGVAGSRSCRVRAGGNGAVPGRPVPPVVVERGQRGARPRGRRTTLQVSGRPSRAA